MENACDDDAVVWCGLRGLHLRWWVVGGESACLSGDTGTVRACACVSICAVHTRNGVHACQGACPTHTHTHTLSADPSPSYRERHTGRRRGRRGRTVDREDHVGEELLRHVHQVVVVRVRLRNHKQTIDRQEVVWWSRDGCVCERAFSHVRVRVRSGHVCMVSVVCVDRCVCPSLFPPPKHTPSIPPPMHHARHPLSLIDRDRRHQPCRTRRW